MNLYKVYTEHGVTEIVALRMSQALQCVSGRVGAVVRVGL